MPDVKFSNQYPYTDFHELNLDWVINEVKYWSTKVGKTIQSIELTGSSGLVDTYTITYSDGTTFSYNVTNGNGIVSVAKTGTAGNVDTYTITTTDGSSYTFTVTNGSVTSVNGMTGDVTGLVPVGDFDQITESEEITEAISTTVTRGFYNANSGIYSANNGYKAFKIPYNGTDKIKVTTYILGGVLAIACFYDSTDTFISSTGIESTTDWYTVTLNPPAGTAYIAVNCRYTGTQEPLAWKITGYNYTVDPASIPDYPEIRTDVQAVIVKGYEGTPITATVQTGFYSYSTGAYSSTSGYKCIKFPYNGTDIINVTTYILANAICVACFYDSTDTFISSTGLASETKWYTDYTLDIPDNTAYIAVNGRYTGIEEPSAYVQTSVTPYVDYTKVLHGKNIVNFGDSIFGSFQDTAPSDKSISSFIADMTGADVLNAGFGGCRMSVHTSFWDAFSMYRIAESINTGSWSVQDAALVSGAGTLPSYFATTVQKLKNVDWNYVDIITIGYGTNDYTGNIPLDDSGGSYTYEYEYFTGALKYSIEKILTAYPHIKILVIGPMWRWFLSGGVYSYSSDDPQSANSNGDFLYEFVDACDDIAKETHVPYVDTYYNLGINKYDYLNYFGSADGTHPAYNGRRLRAEAISAKLLDICGH